MGISFAQKVFADIVQKSNAQFVNLDQIKNTINITSVNDFMKAFIEVANLYNQVNNIPDDKKLVIAEDFPREQLIKLNNETASTDFSDKTLRDIRIVTYLSKEEPAIISSHTPYSDGIRNIKWKYESIYDDPMYTGYSVLRSIKELQVDLTFKVWGSYLQDIRERSKMLKDIIDTNVWYFLQKGLRSIVWTGSIEEESWDGKNLVKFKSEKYQLRIAEVKELRQKNLEQVVIQMGLGN